MPASLSLFAAVAVAVVVLCVFVLLKEIRVALRSRLVLR